MSFWSVVQCETNREHIARLLLMRGDYETYAPRIKVRRRPVLLFPSYLFVRIVNGRWYDVRWTPGIVRVLMNGDEPARLRDEIVESLRRREGKGGFIKLPPKVPKLGSRRKILRGPFEGHIGLHDGMTGPERERVLIDLLGAKIPVELPARDVAPLDVA